ncbi:PREDICTED: odorant receptor 9a-like [Habropoda laboriosa]|uniref:odorant receptor 9a-like n=1 Tax=Habropoda laboriosa TaxID=597456 RepID=UPI00083E27F9|nr:PREDICTED: odorant receptor 9a-like [Habropoda laboriosa]
MAIPSLIEMYVQLRKKNMDDMMESFANTIAAATSLVKLLNVYLNRENFRKMYNLVTIEWEQLRMNDEVHVLQEVTLKGSKLAQLYRNALLFAMCVFLLVPLFGPALDIVLPSNETRPRQQLFRVNYIIFDQADYFFYVYIQLFWCTIVLVMAIITVDSLYMIIIYHASGMFAICGYQVKKATEFVDSIDNSNISQNHTHEQFKRCVTMHDKAIKFYDILNESSRNSYLLQVGLSMMSISVTAVQIMLALDRPSEAIRYSVVLGGAQFHLFIISLPGQTLVDHCTMLTNDIYSSTWYKVSAKFQRVIYMMQIRALKPCILTAGGLYEMNMENFANTFKTCMSYFTMLMSFRE